MTIREARVLDCDRYTSSNGVEKQLMSVSEDNIRKINEKLLKLLHNKKKNKEPPCNFSQLWNFACTGTDGCC